MGRLADMIASYVDAAIRKIPIITAVGTVVSSPTQVSTDPLTVVVDGSATAVPVKPTRGLIVTQGARVVLVRFGTDWVVVGSLTNPAIGTNTTRLVIGANTPAELQAYGIEAAILSYVTDVTTGIERGYFWIGSSNRFDGFGTGRVLAFGNVTYPTPGNPASATVADVKTNFQQNMWGQSEQTIFKDHQVTLWTDFSGEPSNSGHDTSFRWDDEEVPRGPVGTVASGLCTTAPAVTTVAGAERAIPAATWVGEPNMTFKNNHLYAVYLRFGTGITGAGPYPTQTSALVRLRKGSASTTGQVLWANTYAEFTNFTFVGRNDTAYIRNESGADITTKLSLTITRQAAAGATEWSLAGFAPDGGPACDVLMQDLGLLNRSGHGHPWWGGLLGISRAIV